MSYCVYPSILDMEKTLVCIQKINSDLVPKSERLICLVSEAQFVFLGGRFFGFILFPKAKKMVVLSRLPLHPEGTVNSNKSSQQPLDLSDQGRH